MAEENVVAEKGTGKIVSAGKPMKMDVNIPLGNQIAQNEKVSHETLAETPEQIAAKSKLAEDLKNKPATELTPEKKAENIAAGLNEDGSPKVTEPIKDKEAAIKELSAKPLTDEELRTEYEKRFPKQPDLTDEEKQKQVAAFEKRMLDLYVDGGGKIEEFALLKQIASTDLTELTKSELTKELKAAGFNEEEIAILQKERYFQLSDEELEQFENESDREFAKRKRKFGADKLEARGINKQAEAKEFLDNLTEAVNQKDAFVKKESEFVSNVETHFKEIPRKMTLQLGKVDDTEIAPVEFDVPEEAIAKAEKTLKNITSRKELLYNKDGSINLKNIAELVLKSEMFDSALKTTYLEGGNREVEKFEKIFPARSAKDIGLEGNQERKGQPGKIVKAGQPQRFKPAVNQ